MRITGSNFGSSQVAVNGSVTVNGTAAPVISWSSASIVVAVPSGATSGAGDVIVTASGKTSGGAAFTVTTTTAYGACQNNAPNQATFSGTYAYEMRGFGGTAPGTRFVRVGSVTISGSAITGGQEDLNIGAGGNVTHTINSSTNALPSTFTVGPDNRGCLTLQYNDGSMAAFRFSIGSFTGANGTATRGHIIEFDDPNGTGMRASGTLVQQATGISVTSPSNFSFGFEGVDNNQGHISEAGTFLLSGGIASNGYMDLDDAGTLPFGTTGTAGQTSGSVATGSISPTSGRTTATLIGKASCAATCTWHYAVYFINGKQAFAMSTDTLGANTPLVSGRIVQTFSTNLSASTITGEQLPGLGFLLHGSGASTGGVAEAEVGHMVYGANYASTVISYSDGAGAVSSSSSGAFAVSTAGRMTFTPTSGTTDFVFYLTNPAIADSIAGFGIDESNNAAASLVLVLQAAAVVNPSGSPQPSPAPFAFGTVLMSDATVQNQSGEIGVQVTAGSGGESDIFSGVSDQSSESSPYLSSSTFTGLAFTFNPASFGEITGTTDADGHTIAGWANGTAVIFIDETGAAAVTIAQQ